MDAEEALEARTVLSAYLGGVATVHGSEEWEEQSGDSHRFYVSFPEGSNVESQVRALRVVDAFLQQA
jgi:hypothetical protein